MSEPIAVVIDRPFDDVVADTRTALAGEGFGVLTEIDVQATMKAKLDADMDEYLILGACNPPLAHRAVTAMPSIGLLLPCNVVVRREAGKVRVEAVDPEVLVTYTGEPSLTPVADEVAGKLRAALAAIPA